jgi:hypothetical protein
VAVTFNVGLLTGLTPSGMKTAVTSTVTDWLTATEPRLHWTGGPRVQVPFCGVAEETDPDKEKLNCNWTPVAVEAPELLIVK